MATFAEPNADDAIRQLTRTVNALVWQWRQVVAFRYVSGALFWGLLSATIVVLGHRLVGFAIPTTLSTTVIMLTSIAFGLALAKRNFPDSLQVAIAADRKLRMKQRFSTAWEFFLQDPSSPVTGRLALQALRRRLPPPTERVFTPRLNVWGLMVPFAVVLYVLVNVIELQSPTVTKSSEIDAQVVEEGRLLKAFADRMQRTAESKDYARSLTQALALERLATRMQDATLNKQEALGALLSLKRQVSKQRNMAITEASHGRSDSFDEQLHSAMAEVQGLDVAAMLDRLLSGNLASADIDALHQAKDSLAQFGVSSEQLDSAAKNFRAGDSYSLEEILESLSGAENAFGDGEQLEQAEQRLSQASDNLGYQEVQPSTPSTDNESSSSAVETISSTASDPISAIGDAVTSASGASSDADAGRNLDDLLEAIKQSADISSSSDEVTLRPKAQTNPGGSFESQTWALPKIGEISATEQTLGDDFQRQLEAVISKDEYPLHQKQYVRRYFLNLNRESNRE